MNIAGTIEEIAYWEIDYDIPILKGENRNDRRDWRLRFHLRHHVRHC